MIIGKRLRYLYVATPRTSSLSTCNWLKESHGGEDLRGYHSVPKAAELQLFTFTTVRNPFTRAQSIFSWIMLQHRDMYPDLEDMAWLPFLEWLVEDAKNHRHPNAVMVLPMHVFLDGVRLDRVFHFEKIPGCYAELPFVLGMKGFPHNNLGTEPKPRLCLEAQRLIRLWAGKDFERFGYLPRWEGPR